MSHTSNRRRVNYQNQFVYTSPQAIEPHFNNGSINDLSGELRNRYWTNPDGNALRQLHRLQSINYGFDIDNLALNQFGQAGKYGSAVINTPNINFDMEYLLSDGYNERALDFVVDNRSPVFSKYVSNHFPYGKNIFIAIGPSEHDIIGANLLERDVSVVGIGNCFLTQYAVSAEVGSLPKARMTFEGFNVRSYHGVSNLPLPSIIPTNRCDDPEYFFSIPDTYDSFNYPSIGEKFNEVIMNQNSRGVLPGGIKVSLDDGGILAQQSGADFVFGNGSAHIQGFSINVPFGTTRINRLGNTFEFARVYNFPSSIEIKFTALVSEFKESNLFHKLCNQRKHNLVITMHDFCNLSYCRGALEQEDVHVAFYFKNALLDTEALSHSIGDSGRLVEVSFSLPIHDPMSNHDEDFFMFGKSFFPDRPKIIAWGHPL